MRTLRTAFGFVFGLAWAADRRRLTVALVLLAGGYLATPFIGFLLRDFTDAALAGLTGPATALAVGVATLLVVELMLGHFAHLSYFEVGEQAGTVLDRRLLALANGQPGLAHLDDPGFADTLALAAQDAAQTRQSLEGLLHLGGLLLRAAVTTVILAGVDPWLALLPLAAVPPVLVARRAAKLAEHARERTAEAGRLSSHLLALAADANAVKEIRLGGAAGFLLDRQAQTWARTTETLWAAQWRAALLRGCGQLLFAFAYGGAILLVLGRAVDGTATVGEVILVVTLAVQISVQVAGAIGLHATVAAAARTAGRFAELAAAAPAPESASTPAPRRLRHGIRLHGVTFAYPGAAGPTLRDVDLTLPAGATVALVGENGAGKSTLVKLLCGLYTPTSGALTVDGADLSGIEAGSWHRRIAMLFQDFARLHWSVRDNVGVGELAHHDDDAALQAAIHRARAGHAVDQAGGLDGMLGRGYADGTELSGGQWQSLGLARSLMRPRPLLLALDEPAAALDAHAENALFTRFATAARRAARGSGAITLFVSHRFSTVRAADLIVVLRDGTVAELGSHDELMARGGLYHDLFTLQARAYA
ncbi:ABC transporter ATP-binding protein [Catellatospora vulcania]|uniref:ABC transporter ATP-binding protein n=1 Tax=Catellatospora vulcania TaxID=1460450 RepID=UPI0012D49F38|nr:ABC transporter ATP-binding protein [Catellatospora vulcania]